jgi:hypothetical protein
MNIKFFKPKEFSTNLKCTINRSGKLGFSKAAIETLGIAEGKYVKIGINENDENDENDNNLYMVVTDNDDGESFKINKAGEYYYLNTRYLFDELMEDYRNKKIIFDLLKIDYEGKFIYKLNRREIDRKNKK